MTTEFKAYADGHVSTIGKTPQSAAQLFFLTNERARKCSIIEGRRDGLAFVVAYDPAAWPRSYRDITRKGVRNLPA